METHLPHYVVHALHAQPADANGDHLSRSRLFLICCHKHTSTLLADPADMYAKVVRSVRRSVDGHRRMQPQDVFLARQSEVTLEVRIAKDNKAKAKRNRFTSDDPYGVLSASDKKHLRQYEKRWERETGTQAVDDANCIFMLSDNPARRQPTWTLGG